jgi:hypothetical protein
MTDKKRFELACPKCGQVIAYDQPYPYHAGFSDQFFLYNDEGTLTLVWSSWDSTFEPAKGLTWLSPVNEALRKGIEDVLPLAPKGGRWRFGNPARCPHCGGAVSGPMGETVYYLLLPGSIVVRSLNELRNNAP